MKLKVTVDSVPYEVEVEVAAPELALPIINIGAGSATTVGAAKPPRPSAPAAPAGSTVTAPLAGTVSRVLVEVGQPVAADEVVVILEAMKMETEIVSPKAGRVTSILAQAGDPVQGGAGLIVVE
ncbi:MAG: acetyl-CoA carboxylase biotin carboxyl carrier protein subunit [Propionibacteriaceae bacterium]|jgi:methylmalonyl-CoA carboxyltransferase small subunit|nr:acetyl-CoA carboxylase biotin carboxyl carrier protein subunit [Propionibacteriaceae bacterium]